MSPSDALKNIAVVREGGVYPETGNVLPILHEIRHALDRLLRDGETSIIDLRAIPMAPGELERIEKTLGQGEVSCEINALGPSEVRETRYPGVWLVTHHNAAGELVGKFIEITHCPELLRSQSEDIQHGVDQIGAELIEMTQISGGASDEQ